MISKTIGFRGTRHFQTNPNAAARSMEKEPRVRVAFIALLQFAAADPFEDHVW